MRKGEELYGFRVDGVTDVPDVKGRLWRLTYLKNGAQLVWLDRRDDVKTFVIGFKTLPEDDTGVAHILEHSVLCGSRKYPVKSPFGELRKSSPCVFINAMTGCDRTFYPFSTRNDTDFLNLADVYLDAVFHPLSVTNPMAFRQEGWHYEVDPESGKLSYNGVVYNEMKGVFAEPGRTADREILGGLYPDTVYGHDSGGKPEAIPSLTYGEYCAFHAKFYHPSNARIFLDGSIDILAALEKIDSFLRDFERRSDFEEIPLQAPCETKRTIDYPSPSVENKAILGMGWSAGTYDDLPIHTALDIVASYLCESNESPLKRALLEKNLCDDVSLSSDDFKQLPLILMLRNTSENKIEACRRTVEQTLQDELEKGLDARRLRAIINRQEFNERELDTLSPRGLTYFHWAIRHWWYGGDPSTGFKLTEKYRLLRDGVGSGLFERCIRECMLENRHRAEIVMRPVVKDDSQSIGEVMPTLPRQTVEAEAAALKAYQEKPDSPQDIAKMPVFKVSDLAVTGPRISSEISETSSATFIKTATTCDGVAYLALFFPLDGLDRDDLLAIPLFARLFGKLDTEERSAIDLQTELAEKVGRLTVFPIAVPKGEFLRVELAFLSERYADAVSLLKEVLLETEFKDKEAISKVLRQSVVREERHATTAGHALALSNASATLNRRCASNDIFWGLEQLRWLQSANADARLQTRFSVLQKRIFVRNGLILSYTDNLTGKQIEEITELLPHVDKEKLSPPPTRSQSESDGKLPITGLELSADTGYAGWAASLPGGYSGLMSVALRILSLGYLHYEIREIGGAYGAGIFMSSDGILAGYSYRDPSPLHSIEKISGIAAALRTFAASSEPIDKYIVATIALLDTYNSPPDEASRAAGLYLTGQTQEDIDRIRHEILTARKEELPMIADLLESSFPRSRACVVGGTAQLKSENLGLKIQAI